MVDDTAPDGARLAQMLRGYQLTQLLYVCVCLEVPDQLAAGPATATALAQTVGADRDALARVLRSLALLGVLRDEGEAGYSLTALGSLLRSNVAGSQRPAALTYGQPWWWRPWGGLLDAVRTGGTPFDTCFDMPLFDFLSHDQAASAVFNTNMAAMSAADADELVAEFDFADARRIVDVGGGQATMARALLARDRRLDEVVVFDLPSVIGSIARTDAPEFGDRLTSVAGDIFADPPPVAEGYLLKDILHDWDDESCRTILRSIASSAPPGAPLLVLERVLEPGVSGVSSHLVDITMLVMTGGKERSLAEYADLLTATGWRLDACTAAPNEYSVIRATRAEAEGRLT